MSRLTEHGENIGDQIQGEDAYGWANDLTYADVWYILDNLHTHFLDLGNDTMLSLLSRWMQELELLDEDLPS